VAGTLAAIFSIFVIRKVGKVPTEKEALKIFVRTVRAYFKKNGRTLPWRDTTDPYHILVSELMLQQTQVERVIPKYHLFLKTFPTLEKLARAPLGDVLRVWVGLGYNRRAKLLHACAQEIIASHKGVFPETYESLLRLPGIGPYTAGALLAFAFNTPHTIIETNIRAVFIYHFFPGKEKVPDAALLPLIERTLDTKNPRIWYAMLMDYGSWIKKEYGNPNRKSAHHSVQKKFEGSVRQIRGAVLRFVSEKSCTTKALALKASVSHDRLNQVLQELCKEGLIIKKRAVWELP
jgi:A/G-specific adenine glycosylase